MQWRRKHSPGHASRVRGLMEAALVFVIAVSLAACTDRPATEDEFAADTAGGLTGDTTGMMAESPAMQQDTVDVELVAFEIDMPQTLPAGETVFEVENTGEMEHGFEIERQETADRGMDDPGMDDQGMDDEGMNDPLEGQGIAGQQDEWSIDSIPVGETESITANLEAGTYVVYCPVDNHREEGMEMTLRVEESQTTAQVY